MITLVANQNSKEVSPELNGKVDSMGADQSAPIPVIDHKTSSPPLISVVSPVYKAEAIVHLLVTEIKKELSAITENYEIVLVEDGSADNSWQKIMEEASKDKRVKGIRLSRNFGQHYAITAGLDHANGSWVIVMDCDLQDKPSEISKLYNKAMEGYEVVLARREVRNDTWLKKVYSRSFYYVLTQLTGVKQDASIANFGIYSSNVINAIREMREPIRYFPTMVRWVGFQRTAINVEHGEREIGKTTYNFKRLLRLAKDIILANSERPIYGIVMFGFVISIISFVIGLVTLVQYFRNEILVVGYTSLIISIWFLGGIIIMILGVIGLYLGKTFEGVKKRPIYISNKTVNID